MARVVALCKSVGHSKLVQLAHAGRKASTQRPWEGGSALQLELGKHLRLRPWPLILHGIRRKPLMMMVSADKTGVCCGG